MATYYFQLLDHQGVRPTEMAYDFDNAEAAIEEARTALTEMAADGLPGGEYNMLSVEVFDNKRRPVREIRLVLEEIDKTLFDASSQGSKESHDGH
ncbi:hypothetical protein [Rhizobium sp. S163]|uniref:DUF6894 family protein n=1 Tax=Rhizobium sp. S163 TaxID=3055039 RepID=UPI0025AA208D|nr:hypothetical protein [Rhizobium sp. S163]MDM9644794.1 hypothetical protein [Rhizobium sp. S163]